MPRRKQYKIPARQTAIYGTIVPELQKNPELAGYGMETIEILVKKKIIPRIQDVDKAINNLTKYINTSDFLLHVLILQQIILIWTCGLWRFDHPGMI